MTRDKALALIGRYWDLAWEEGNEGRECDTPDSEAQEVWSLIEAHLTALHAEVERLRRDAVRYRALAVMPDQEWVTFTFQKKGYEAYGPVNPINRKPWLDAAIDAAMEAGIIPDAGKEK